MKLTIKNHLLYYLIFIILVIFLAVYSMRISTIFDEDYTLQLINNSFSKIIKFDALDVHPPLYYFILKVFLIATTFWTKSFIIKVIFARLFEVIISIITFIYLINISEELKIHINDFIQFFLFLMIPGVISLTYELVKIRMYSLSALFITISIYELVKYNKNEYNIYLIIFTIMSILSFYTNYYSAIISGFIILVCIIKYFVKRNKSWMKFLLSGFMVLISFTPWVPIFFKQLSLQSTHPQGLSPKQWIGTIGLLIIFLYPLLWAKKHLYFKIFKLMQFMLIINLLLLIFMLIVSIVDQPVLNFRYFYPCFLLYGFIGMDILYIMIHNKKRLYSKVLFILLLLFLVGGYTDQLYYYGKNSLQIVKEFDIWSNSYNYNNKIVTLKNINNSDQNFDVEKIMFLSNNDIKVRANRVNNVKWIETEPAYKSLFKIDNNHIINR